MATVRKSAIVSHACEGMFDLVDRVEDYPEFLPWCAGTRLIERTDTLTVGRIDIEFKGVRSHIVTRNAKERPRRMTLELLEGPFRDFRGEWTFAPLGDSGCRVELAVEYAFSNPVLELALGGLFGHITGTLVDRFVERANESTGGGA
jgi:ribosome-associated toxin RatA of RatAB toxin-antitoxin module